MADQPNTERLQRLEEEVNQRVRDALASLREQIAERLRRLSDETLKAVEGLGGDDPPSVFTAADLEPLARAADAAGGGRAAGDLVAAIAALDRARSQADVLSTLAAEARRFAGRTAVLLTREERAELWSAEGWDDAPAELAFEYPSTAGWSPADFGRSAVELSGEAAAELTRRLGAGPAASAVLVPLVLRDRLAAVLYADGESPFPLAASLQVLTWGASQALESLPFRQREATPTLAGLGAGAAVAEAPALWGGGGAAGPAATAEEAGPSTGRTVGVAAAGFAAAGLAAAGLVKARRARDEEDESAGDAAEEAAPSAADSSDAEPAVVEASAAGFDAFDEIVLEEGPGPEVAAPPVSLPGDADATGEAPRERSTGDMPWDDADTASVAGPQGAGEPAREAEEEDETDDRRAESLTFAEAEDAGEEEDATGDTTGEDEPAVRSELTPPGESVDLDETHPAAGVPPAATDAVESTAAETSDEATAEAPTPEGPAAGEPAAEVAPPADLDGPGRAFSGRQAAPDEEQARHDEARRLARLLVSEIRLYNEDEVEVGRRNADIYERLREDIDRSRQMYEERVDPRVREGNDYFYEELVRNLGGGDARVLGI
ncbi:MAG TPA: hypothetical protein VM617_06505 [Thermoanaerobaculia bacterium]|nr:hypothetical protein [Thermoanaerobaculia bacterium]